MSRGGPSWVELAQAELGPSWSLVNRAEGGAWVQLARNGPAAWKQLHAALDEDRPDAVIFAFGTNDVRLLMRDDEVPSLESIRFTVRFYERLANHALRLGTRPIIALTPPTRPDPSSPRRADVTRQLNVLLSATFPGDLLLDFWSPMRVPEDFTDIVHVGPSGQARRAEVAVAALRALERCDGRLALPSPSAIRSQGPMLERVEQRMKQRLLWLLLRWGRTR